MVVAACVMSVLLRRLLTALCFCGMLAVYLWLLSIVITHDTHHTTHTNTNTHMYTPSSTPPHTRRYHAKLPLSERVSAHRAFQRDDASVMVASLAFGMGIDKPK